MSTDNPDPFPWETPDPSVARSPHDASLVDGEAADGAAYPGEEIEGRPKYGGALAQVDRHAVDALLDQLAGEPVALSAYTSRVRDSVAEIVRKRAADRFSRRPDKVETKTDLLDELVGAANDHDVLTALAGVFTTGAGIAKGIAGDLLDELPLARGKPVRTVKVGDGQGSELEVHVTVRTEPTANLDEIVDVLAAWQGGAGGLAETEGPVAYAQGVRAGMTRLLGVLASPKVKSTVLDKLVTDLEASGDKALAKRLRKAYGRRDVGEPSVKLDRTPLYADPADTEAQAEALTPGVEG